MGARREREPRCSTYGLEEHTPEATKNQWLEYLKKQHWILENHVNAGLVKERQQKQHLTEKTYYNNHKQHAVRAAYDRQFHVDCNYNNKVKRDDRMACIGLDINAEETKKKIPILSSSVYGKRESLENPTRMHCRVALVQRDFYRNCGTNIPSSQNADSSQNKKSEANV